MNGLVSCFAPSNKVTIHRGLEARVLKAHCVVMVWEVRNGLVRASLYCEKTIFVADMAGFLGGVFITRFRPVLLKQDV